MKSLAGPTRKKVGMNGKKVWPAGRGKSLVSMPQKPVEKFKLIKKNLVSSQNVKEIWAGSQDISGF